MVGTVIGQAIPILFSPILTRQYTPENFGILASFLAVVAILSPLVSGRYELAVLLPKTKDESQKVIATTKFLVLISSLVLLLIFILFNSISDYQHILSKIDYWYILLPVTIAATALFLLASQVSIRNSQYKSLSIAKIIQGIVSTAIPISFFFLSQNELWLILGSTFGFLLALAYLKSTLSTEKISKQEIIQTLQTYKNHPTHILPTEFLNSASRQGVIFLISVLFGSSIAGLYFMTQRVVMAPVSLIGNSISQVFFKKFTETVATDREEAKRIIVKAWLALAIAGIIPFTLIIIFGAELFSYIFGEEWRQAGKMASILSFTFYISFISSPTSSAFITLKLTKYSLYFGVYAFITRFLAIYIGYILGDIMLGIILLAVTEVIQTVAYNYIIWKHL